MLWNSLPPPKVKPRPGEPVWTMRKGSKLAECELRYHGEYGVEAQFFRDGTFFSGRRFDTKTQALAWAKFEREALEKQGWTGTST